MSSLTELKWKTLTRVVNEIKSPNQFLKKRYFSRHKPVNTEDIEIDLKTKGRQIAPFVRKNGEAIMVEGSSATRYSVSAPNIRIKRPFTPSELLFGRQPGTDIYIDSGAQANAVQSHIAEDLQLMGDYVTNAEEWLCAQAIQGVIAYEVADQEVFTITFPKPSGNNITLTTFWNDGTAGDVKVLEDIHTVKKVLADEVGLTPTDAICGESAATQLRLLAKGGYITLDNRTLNMGNVDFTTQYNDDGVIYIGRIAGVDFWEYSRTAELNGSDTAMIRTKYVEFLSTSANSDRVLYYGAIPDMKALQGKRFVGERFSKSWEQEDPSAFMALLHSRPLPVPRRPGANVSMKVISG